MGRPSTLTDDQIHHYSARFQAGESIRSLAAGADCPIGHDALREAIKRVNGNTLPPQLKPKPSEAGLWLALRVLQGHRQMMSVLCNPELDTALSLAIEAVQTAAKNGAK